MKRLAAKFVTKLQNFDQKQRRNSPGITKNKIKNASELFKTVVTGEDTFESKI